MSESELRALLDHLAQPAIAARLDEPDSAPVIWGAWRVSRVTGSQNNRIYRATSPAADLAIKLTLRDQYDRAIREYASLRALEQAGLPDGSKIGPRALLLDQDRYETPVVVLSWLEGTPCQAPPTTDDDWRGLVQTYADIHSVTPERVPASLPTAVLMMRSAAEGLECIHTQLRVIPTADQPPEVRRLVARFETQAFPTWSPPPVSLCQADANFRNLLRGPGRWAAVDWEYSGWGDPAFEITGLMAHAAYLDVPPERWAWVRQLYVSMTPHPGVAERIAVYTPLMYGFWVARFARMLYEVPRGGDRRLTPWPEGWLDAVRGRYERYLELANRALQP